MPPAVPLVAVAAGYAVSASIAAIPLGALAGGAFVGLGLSSAAIGAGAGFVVSTAINQIGARAFSPKSGSGAAAQSAHGQSLMLRSSVESHKIVYGTAKVSGPIILAASSNSGPIPTGGPVVGTNIILHLVIPLAGHEIQSIDNVYFDNVPLTLDANGYASNMPWAGEGGVTSTKTLSTAVRASEIVTATTTAVHGFAVGDQIEITGVSDTSMNGIYLIATTPSTTTFTYANGGVASSATGGSVEDKTITATSSSYVRVKKHLGSSSQAADSDMMAEIPGWTSAHQLKGIAYIYVRLQYNISTFSRGLPNISAVIKGKKLYDPRTGLTAWSANSALCARDYMATDYGFNCDSTEFNDTYWNAAANICDEDVTLSTGGSQDRYTTNGVIDTAATPLDNLNALVAAMAGTVTYVQGQFRAYAGAYDATVGSIDLDKVVGNISIQTRPPRTEVFNMVRGTYVDPFKQYMPTDFPGVTNATYVTQDGGDTISRDIALTLTNHPEASQRIAKVILEQGRQGITVGLPMNHNALQYAVWDTVTFTNAPVGWSSKVFRIKNIKTSGISPFILQLQEDTSASYDWSNGESSTRDAAPDTNLPNPFIVATTSGLTYTSRIVTASGSVSVYNLVAQWTLHPDIFVQHGGRIEVQYKLSSEADFRPSFYVNGDLTTADILSTSVATNYDIRIRAISALGIASRSAWSTITGASVGASGGIASSEDWGNWTDAVGSSEDWTNWTNAVGSSEDYGYWT